LVAVDDLTKCLQLKPDYVGALVKRGEAFEQLGNSEKALADFRSALELAPDFKDARDGVNRLTSK
jgi:tetratricopeptide repeat protein 1